MKPRVMSLVLFTCMVGLVIAPTEVDIIMAIVSLLAVSLGAGAAGTLNMWYRVRSRCINVKNLFEANSGWQS